MVPSLFLSIFLWLSTASALPQLFQETLSHGAACDCSGTEEREGTTNPADYICRDSRLGPRVLPTELPLGTFLTSYDRFGGSTPDEFLKQWWNSAKNDWWYPDHKGFQLDDQGNPINGTVTLTNGTLVDRFGEENGRYFSAAAASYAQRSLPPQNLDTNPKAPDFPYSYHVYMVKKDLTVIAGPIRPWFGQPGLGTQFFTGGPKIRELVAQGILEKQETSVLIKKRQGCGF